MFTIQNLKVIRFNILTNTSCVHCMSINNISTIRRFNIYMRICEIIYGSQYISGKYIMQPKGIIESGALRMNNNICMTISTPIVVRIR